jgi:hypothetical protein
MHLEIKLKLKFSLDSGWLWLGMFHSNDIVLYHLSENVVLFTQ